MTRITQVANAVERSNEMITVRCEEPSNASVITTLDDIALYFIDKPAMMHGVYNHVPIYGCRLSHLVRLVSLEPTKLEIELGMPIMRAVEVGDFIRVIDAITEEIC